MSRRGHTNILRITLMSIEKGPSESHTDDNEREAIAQWQSAADRIEQPHTPQEKDLSNAELEAWGLASTAKELLDQARISSPEVPNREAILEKTREILALIPVWTKEDDDRDEAARRAWQEHLKSKIE